MMHLIKILFLGISIFFSFGFTTYQSNCGKQENKIEESAHSCCSTKKISECTKSSDCKADCCIQTTDYFVFDQFVIGSEEVTELTVFESIKNFNREFYLTYIGNTESKNLINDNEFLNFKRSGRYIISLKQSWLI